MVERKRTKATLSGKTFCSKSAAFSEYESMKNKWKVSSIWIELHLHTIQIAVLDDQPPLLNIENVYIVYPGENCTITSKELLFSQYLLAQCFKCCSRKELEYHMLAY